MRMIVEHSPAPAGVRQRFEVVERKGVGHPDTICDALAEAFSVGLCRFYVDRFGVVLHHNVDKALLVGGRSRPAFGGGELLEPIEIYLAGRATTEFDGVAVPCAEIAEEACRHWFRSHLPQLDPERHLRIRCRIRPGSRELVELFARQIAHGQPLANDTSCGVGFAPLTLLEGAVLDLERALREAALERVRPEIGADIKVMGVRLDEQIDVTLACALVDRYVEDLEDYAAKRAAIASLAQRTCASARIDATSVTVNAADDLDTGDVYLTVTGTSAEAGDDGEVGRGNRANGLITPFRPMTLEAAAGKNPVTHVGKLYNVAAQRIAAAVVDESEVVEGAQCTLVSRIGAPVDAPWIAHLALAMREGLPASSAEELVEAIVERELAGLRRLWQDTSTGAVGLF